MDGKDLVIAIGTGFLLGFFVGTGWMFAWIKSDCDVLERISLNGSQYQCVKVETQSKGAP